MNAEACHKMADIVFGSVRQRRIRTVFGIVDRAEFIPPGIKANPYSDKVIPTVPGSSLSQPSLVGKMLDYLDPQPGFRILEIGTATGYNAALTAELVGPSGQVETYEINNHLVKLSRMNLARLGYQNVEVHKGDGLDPAIKPYFDGIIVTAALTGVPEGLIAKLNLGGRLIVPVGIGTFQDLVLIERDSPDNYIQAKLGEVAFCPAISKHPGGFSPAFLRAIRREKMELVSANRAVERARAIEHPAQTFGALGKETPDDLFSDQVSEAEVNDTILTHEILDRLVREFQVLT